MILLCGIPSESPLAMVGKALDELGVDYHMLNQRQVAALDIAWQIDARQTDGAVVEGTLRIGKETLRLGDVTAGLCPPHGRPYPAGT
jgi:hypothetical protein